MKHIAVHRLVQFFRGNMLQGNVATPFRCGGNFNDSFVANFFPESNSEKILKIGHSLAKI